MKIVIKNIDRKIIRESDSDSLRAALESAVAIKISLRGADLSRTDLSGADLRGVDLRWSDLSGVDLSGSDLSGSDLSGADLRRTDLIGANLSQADLSRSDLRGTDLRRTDLSGVNLIGVDLSGAKINWKSHQLISEILWRAADTIERQKVAAYIRMAIDLCWETFLELNDPETDWALIELKKWVTSGDNAPAVIMDHLSE